MATGKRRQAARGCDSTRKGRKCLGKPSGDEKENKILCICGEDKEFGEMASCEICAGWFHFRCLGYKEDVWRVEALSAVSAWPRRLCR